MKNFASAVHALTKLFLTLLLTLCAVGLYAQLGTLSVQGVLTKADGTAVDDNTYNIEFSLWKNESSTNTADRVHVETVSAQTTGGVYSVILGLNTPFGPAATFSQPYFLGVKYGSTELLPRPRLTAAPYAMALLGASNSITSSGPITVDGVLSDSYAFKSSNTSGMFWEGETKLKHNGATRLLIGSNGTNYVTGPTVFNNDNSTTGRVNSSVGFGYNGTGTGLFFDGTENKASIYTTGTPRFHAWDDGRNYYRATNGHFFDVGGVTVQNDFSVLGQAHIHHKVVTNDLAGQGGYTFFYPTGGPTPNFWDDDSGLFGGGDGVIRLYLNGQQSFSADLGGFNVYTRLFLHNVPNNVDGHNLEWNPPGKGSGDNMVSINTSTRRFKHNIVPLEEDFTQLLKLQPKRYTRTLDPSGPTEIGYIAEEVDSLGMKCLVLYEDADNKIPLSINYKKLVLFTNEIVKMHDAEIEKLKAEVAALTAEKNALRTENSGLRTMNSALQNQQAAFGKQLEAITRRIQSLETTAGQR